MNYIIVYKEVRHLLKFLTESERSQLWDVLFDYSETKDIGTISSNLENVFNILKPKLDSHMQKAELKAKIARQNGAVGGRPKTKIKPKRTQSKPKITQLVLPDFVSRELWESYVEMRVAKKKPLTERATKLILNDLEKFEKKQKDLLISL